MFFLSRCGQPPAELQASSSFSATWLTAIFYNTKTKQHKKRWDRCCFVWASQIDHQITIKRPLRSLFPVLLFGIRFWLGLDLGIHFVKSTQKVRNLVIFVYRTNLIWCLHSNPGQKHFRENWIQRFWWREFTTTEGKRVKRYNFIFYIGVCIFIQLNRKTCWLSG